MAYGYFKVLPKRTAAGKVLCNTPFKIVKNPRYDEYQRGLSSIVYKFCDKKTAGGGVKNEIMQNKELAKELHKPIIRKFEKWKVHSSFIDNIWGANLAGIKILRKFYVLRHAHMWQVCLQTCRNIRVR